MALVYQLGKIASSPGLRRRLLSLLLVWTLVLSCAPTALAAESTTAATMRLMKTQGTVTITNSTGRSVPTRDSLQLRSGYGVDTKESSYAWINLDDAKLIKEDAVSEISIRKSGKKLDILLESGNLFFNVTEPLDEDETFNIRTSTMAIGIRGTCGWVKVIDQWTSQVYVLEGSIQVTVTDPVTGETKTETLSGGENAVCTVYTQDHPGDKCDIIRNTYSIDDIDGFVLVEAVPDTGLCDKIYEDSGLDLRNYSGNPEDKLEQDQEAVRDKLAAIESQVAQQDRNISTTPVWSNPAADGTDSPSTVTPSYSGGGSRPSSSTTTLVMPQEDDTVNNLLSQSNVSGVILQPGTGRASTINMLEVDSGIAVPAGKTLTLQDGVSMSVLSGQTVQVAGTATVGGNLDSSGTVGVSGRLTVDGTFSGTVSPSDGASVRALAFQLSAPIPGWHVSADTDSDGYYTLDPGDDGGKAGENVYWSYTDATKTLRIWGTGPMTDFSTASPSTAPWYQSYRSSIVHAVVENGVTTIGGNAFMGLTQMTDVTIPDSVTSLGSSAFSMCSVLRDVTIPNGVTSIGRNMFSMCRSLKTVTIPATVTSIDSGAFTLCMALTDVYYGSTKARWDAVGYRFASNVTVHFVEEPTTYTVTFDFNDGTGRTSSAQTNTEGKLDITAYPDVGVSYTFSGWYTAPTGGTVINENTVFTANSTVYAHWTDTTAADSGDVGTLHWSYDRTAKTLTITGTGAIPDFGGATSDDGSTATNAPWDRYRAGMQSVVLGSGVTTIGAYTFPECSNLTSITIPASVTQVNNYATSGSNSLAEVNYGGTETQWNAVSIARGNEPLVNANKTFTGTSTTRFTVTFDPNGGTVSPASAQTGVYNRLNESDYPTPTREGYTFDGWYTSATGGTRLSSGFTYTQDTTIYAHWTQDAAPASGTAGENVLWDYTEGTKTLRIWGTGGMYDFKTASVSAVPWESVCSEIENVVIESGVTKIGMYSFADCSSLSSITIPDSVVTINGYSFANCSNLTEIAIPNGVASIYTNTFNGCTSLTTITIPSSVTRIYNEVFKDCTGLTNVYYTGTTAQWNAITIGSSNDPLTSANIQYNPTRSIVSNTAPGYTDIPAGAWYAEAANYCRENNLMNGTSETEFSPDATLTRAMMVTVLHRLAGKPAAASTANFADVPAGKWYSDAIAWANSKGIVLGYPDGTFGTNDPVTHEQVALIFQRYSGNPNVETVGADSPKTPATRAEIAATLMNYTKGGKTETLAPGTLSTFSAMDVMCGPSGIALDSNGTFLVTDIYNKQVWRVLNRASQSYAGGTTVQDLYGQPVGGYNDAGLDASYFKQPWAIAPFLDGWAVSDTENNVVRLIQTGSVQTLNGATREKLKVTELGVAFDHPTGLASDGEGNLYVSDTFNGAVRRITPEGGVSTVAQNLSEPAGLCWKDGVLYIAETGKNRIVKVQDGKVSAVAGNGSEGLYDSAAERSTFNAPQGVTVGDDGSIYVADTGNSAIRKIADGKVTTLAVRDPEQLNGGLTNPIGLLVQGEQLFICDTFARKVFVYQLG